MVGQATRAVQATGLAQVHLGNDARAQEIRAIEVTGSRVGDAPVLPGLLDQILGDQPPGIAAADGACVPRA